MAVMTDSWSLKPKTIAIIWSKAEVIQPRMQVINKLQD